MDLKSQIQELKYRLLKAKEAYYNSDQPIMTDEEFDFLEDQLKKLSPNDEYFKIVGTESNGNKIKHLIPMLSQNKASNIEELIDWHRKTLSKYNIKEYLLEPKIDGLSCTIVYENGNLNYIATRGNGLEGQNITHIKDLINTILPSSIIPLERTEIRGELYIPKNASIHNPENKPLRNLASGLINRKENLEDLKYIEFIAYQVHSSKTYTSEDSKLKDLISWGFNVVWSEQAKTLKEIEDIYSLYLTSFRETWNYETDGLVIIVNDTSLHEKINSNYKISHHNFYCIALKPPAEGRQTKLLKIEWEISRLGNIIPIAVFEPIFIQGVTITRATLSNYKTVLELQLEENDTIYVTRANDVIPYVVKNITKNIKRK